MLPVLGRTIPNAGQPSPGGRGRAPGLTLGEEDANKNGELLGASVALTIANAPGPGCRPRRRTLIAQDKVTVLGRLHPRGGRHAAFVAAKVGALVFNIGATPWSLRRARRANCFHIEVSAAMYIDAVFG